ncbi:MAG: 16S rRNA (adenine(1518)-N(6)/adenine(1519)-N(6))-dimethyltransferase RsmA [Acidobacteriota bacterium]|nr:16S rRNA (adenine(1518)-N(6)/adenine(1519)-N(6))-dimethyltransferase RsmA [Acidobacteriota bacterium]
MPRKLGQHFLIRDSILEKLAVAACGEHAPRVVEIGPGRGALTRHLLPRADEIHALELDTSLAAYLQTKFASEPKLHIHEGDVLAADITQWGPAVVTGNLPYYITSPIIEKFLNLDSRFESAVFLMQWEVAERILAQPGTRDYGYLTVCVRLLCDVELVCKAPPSAFAPPPNVDSAGVKFVRRSGPPVNLDSLRKLVSRSFAHKRKTLRNNLRPFYGESVTTLPEAGLRAEQLTIPQFIDLHARLVDTPENG